MRFMNVRVHTVHRISGHVNQYKFLFPHVNFGIYSPCLSVSYCHIFYLPPSPFYSNKLRAEYSPAWAHTACRVGWSDFWRKNWTHFRLCQIVMGPQFQNFTLKCCFLAWHRVSENFDCYPKIGNFFSYNF